MGSDDQLLLPIAMRGRVPTYYHWIGTAILGAILGVGPLLFIPKAFAAIGDCLADVLGYGGLGGLAALGAGFYLIRAAEGVPLSRLASQREGSVRVDGQLLTISSPGVLQMPVALERAWISDVVDKAPHDVGMSQIAFLHLSRHTPTTFVILSGPLGLPISGIRGNPGALDGVAGPPTPTTQVDVLALDLENPDVANNQLRTWLATTYAMQRPPPSSPKVPKKRWPFRLGFLSTLVAACAYTASWTIAC